MAYLIQSWVVRLQINLFEVAPRQLQIMKKVVQQRVKAISPIS